MTVCSSLMLLVAGGILGHYETLMPVAGDALHEDAL